MINRRMFLSAMAALVPSASALGENSPSKLGALTPFYRSTQLQGHLFGMGLMDIPEYLTVGVDIKYRRNPNLTQEIPFVDTFSIVRFMGGYRTEWLKKFHLWNPDLGEASLDYVTRDAGGNLTFRADLIKDRLSPYLTAGYQPKDITLALDNVPWALAKDPTGQLNTGVWGQDMPPKDMALWSKVVAHFGDDLAHYLGAHATDVSFETGVEYDERVSFNGSSSEFFEYFLATYTGLKTALPDAKLSPGEFTGLGECTNSSKNCSYDSREFLDFAKAENIPVHSLPRSLYGMFASRKALPSTIVNRAVIAYARLPGVIPEIHQFGLLGQPFGSGGGSDPGVAQAAWQFQTLIGLWQRIRPRRVFHWGGFTSVGKFHLLNGPGFLRMILDHYLGCSVTLPISTDDTDVDDSTAATEIMAAQFSSRNQKALIVSSFSTSLKNNSRRVSIQFTPSLKMPIASELRSIRYRVSENVLSSIRDDLEAQNNLKAVFAINRWSISDPLSMAINPNAARSMIESHWTQYVSIMRNNLQWRKEKRTSISVDGILQTDLEPNEILVLDWS